jgi:beta-ribofuranosylaminobenzene 5'-phosphate synthase
MTAGPLRTRIREIEREIGYLSPLQTLLLLTDGSVTTLLEAISGDEVSVTTLSQVVAAPGKDVAAALEIGPGEMVNHRTVVLKNSRTREVLVYAVSYTPLLRLEPGFTDDLMRADIPIGKILKKHAIESRREIQRIGIRKKDAAITRAFGNRPGPFLFRDYTIIRAGKPLMMIEEFFPASAFTGEQRVIIEAPSRLHLGLIDLNGALGRVDGGIGIALDHPRTVIEACRTRNLTVLGGDEESNARAGRAAEAVISRFGLRGAAQIVIHEAPPGHRGLGSGTALSLAVARAICELHGLSVKAGELAKIVGRGGTSGIGTAAFESGGFILDGGHAFGTHGEKMDFRPSSASVGIDPAPVIARHHFPEDWQIHIIIPSLDRLVSGGLEEKIFRESCPVPIGEVRETCHEVVMRMLPGIVENDIELFGAAVNRIQELGFKRLEISRQPPLVPALIAGLKEAGAPCAGMSSFGPAVFAITESGFTDPEREVRDILGDISCRILRTKANNHGTSVHRTSAPPLIDPSSS